MEELCVFTERVEARGGAGPDLAIDEASSIEQTTLVEVRAPRCPVESVEAERDDRRPDTAIVLHGARGEEFEVNEGRVQRLREEASILGSARGRASPHATRLATRTREGAKSERRRAIRASYTGCRRKPSPWLTSWASASGALPS